MVFDPKTLNNYPISTGVYLMKDSNSHVIYVGKANNLRNRLKQYFIPGRDTRAMISILVSQVNVIETIIVDTEKEALILECNLIKKYKPKYNILLKDDKTYASLVVTKEKWPIIKLVRKKKKKHSRDTYFGPYTNAKAARHILNIILSLFPLRQCSNNIFKNRTRPCILYDIKRCIGPCCSKCTDKEYMQMVGYAISLLKGKNKDILKDLNIKMKVSADNLEYEKAQNYLEKINHIKHILQTQYVDNLSSKNCDALGIYQDGKSTVISKLIYRESKLIGSNYFSFTQTAEDEISILESFILQHYNDANIQPSTILIPINLSNKNTLIEILNPKKLKIIFPQKGEKLSLIKMANKNAKEALNQEKDANIEREKLLLSIQSILHLSKFPHHIKCFDTSHISETNRVASMVTFINGKLDKSKMKLFIIKTKDKGDTASLEEILYRYFSKQENLLCDLVIVDGGKGQLNTALKVFNKLNIVSIDVIGIAKQQSRHDKGLTSEQLFSPFDNKPIMINPKSPILFLLQNIRDEAHKAAISFHRRKRDKEITKSTLDNIEGIGEIKKKALLQYFKSIEEIKRATKEELKKIGKLTRTDIENIDKYFHRILIFFYLKEFLW